MSCKAKTKAGKPCKLPGQPGGYCKRHTKCKANTKTGTPCKRAPNGTGYCKQHAPRETAGRPTKWTQEMQDQIVKVIKVGNYIETAAVFAGISKDTLYDWLKRGRAGEDPYAGFSDAVEGALAASEVSDVNRLFTLAQSDARVIEWRLERRFPQNWGRQQRIEVAEADKDGGNGDSVNDLIRKAKADPKKAAALKVIADG